MTSRTFRAAGLALAAISFARAADKPRVFIADRQPFQVSGGTEDVKGSLLVASGATSESVQVMKYFAEFCPDVIVTSSRDKAQYIVMVHAEEVNPGTPFYRGNRLAVFNREDDLIYSSSARLLKNAVRDTCAGLTKKKP